jgi:hypothetical protein
VTLQLPRPCSLQSTEKAAPRSQLVSFDLSHESLVHTGGVTEQGAVQSKLGFRPPSAQPPSTPSRRLQSIVSSAPAGQDTARPPLHDAVASGVHKPDASVSGMQATQAMLGPGKPPHFCVPKLAQSMPSSALPGVVHEWIVDPPTHSV